MRVNEIISGLDPVLLERIGNGSRFRDGPPSVNSFDDCVDPSDPKCPGHMAGWRKGMSHPNTPLKPNTSLSFANGFHQALNMLRKGYKSIGPTIQRHGKFISATKPAPTNTTRGPNGE